MIVKMVASSSFRATAHYLLHDKRATTDERVAWTHIEHCHTQDPHQVAAEQAHTAANARALKREAGLNASGRSVRNPAAHFVLSWAPDENPSRQEMLDAAREAMRRIGLERHQRLIVAHSDQPQPHVHILANRIDRENGRANRLSLSKRKLSEWAFDYEKAQGQIRCKQRPENQRKLERGEKPRYGDAVIKDAWARSDSGKAFQRALAEQGYTLAMGRKRLVVVDREGKTVNPVRELKEVKAAEFNARMKDLDREKLADAEALSKTRKESKARGDAETMARRAGRDQGQDKSDTKGDAKAEAGVGSEAARAVGKEKGDGRGAAETAQAAWERTQRAVGETLNAKARDTETPNRWQPRNPPVFDRDRYHARWQEKVDQAGIDKDRTREAREAFQKAPQDRQDSARRHVQGGAQKPPEAVNDNARRAALQSRHFDEQITLERRHQQRVALHEEKLAQTYDTEAKRAEQQRIAGKRWLWPRDQQRLLGLKLSIANADYRANEARATLRHQLGREMEALHARQSEERMGLERTLEARASPARVSPADRAARPEPGQAVAASAPAQTKQGHAPRDALRELDAFADQQRAELASRLAEQQRGERERLARMRAHIESGRLHVKDPSRHLQDIEQALEHLDQRADAVRESLEREIRERRRALEAAPGERPQGYDLDSERMRQTPFPTLARVRGGPERGR